MSRIDFSTRASFFIKCFSERIYFKNFFNQHFHLLIVEYFCFAYQPWELAAAFGNAVVNAVLCWFYDGKIKAVVTVFTYMIFLFRFYSVVDNS